ncbi:MAG: hypothetical protein C0478_11365 [Planctomyces sp.]|nr:hypothetical protein [Planctomyces sp.]
MLDELISLISPPQAPLYSQGDWQKVEKDLGVVLPADYKELISVYGAGTFNSGSDDAGLQIFSYLSPWGAKDQGAGMSELLKSMLTSFSGNDDYKPPASFYPDLPGLLHFGTYLERDELLWLVPASGAPHGIVWFALEEGFITLPGIGVTELLLSIIRGNSILHQRKVIQDSQPGAPYWFNPGS